jgi:hypothetical protein|tara:strand:- start:410 stop:1084 length:675 start_codon:yes stop_codon:yes gene_type:complete
MNIDEKFKNFELFVHRRYLARFIVRYELFKKIMNIEGSIIECGVWNGGGVLAWGKLSEIFEPYAIKRKIIGFDTFEGFPHVNDKDKGKNLNPNVKKGAFKPENSTYDEILSSIEIFNNERYLNQFNKIELVKGDALRTIPDFVNENNHLIVALLFLDFDLYEPTKVALETLLPRVPKGGIVAFDEINNPGWPGETMALVEQIATLNKIEIRKFHFDANIAYITI